MNWIVYTVGAALALAAADVFVKLAAGKLANSLGLLLYGSVAFFTGLIWFLVDRTQKVSQPTDPLAVLFALGVGVTFTLVTIGLYAAFRAGTPISVVSPLIRLGGLIVASVVGLLFWKEPVNLRYALGMALSCLGIYLIVTR